MCTLMMRLTWTKHFLLNMTFRLLKVLQMLVPAPKPLAGLWVSSTALTLIIIRFCQTRTPAPIPQSQSLVFIYLMLTWQDLLNEILLVWTEMLLMILWRTRSLMLFFLRMSLLTGLLLTIQTGYGQLGLTRLPFLLLNQSERLRGLTWPSRRTGTRPLALLLPILSK